MNYNPSEIWGLDPEDLIARAKALDIDRNFDKVADEYIAIQKEYEAQTGEKLPI